MAGYIFFECQLLWGLIYLWDRLLCWVKAFLEEKVFSQRPHGMHIPAKWLASMWSLIKVTNPSLPHTLQINDVAWLGVPFACLPLGIIFWPFSIIDLTFTPSAWRSALFSLGIATAVEVFGATTLGFRFIWWVVDFFALSLLLWFGFSCSSTRSVVVACPVKPYSWISSAMARKESKSSW